MNAKVSIKIELIDGEDQGYTLEDSRVVPIFEPLPSKYVTPYSIKYNFMTPELHRKIFSRDMKPDTNSTIGFEDLNILPVAEVIDRLQRIRDAAEPIQVADEGFSTLVKDVQCEGSFKDIIYAALTWLERIPKED